MPENYIELPDTKKLVVFETNQHPDFSGISINIQETLNADIPTYSIVADNISTALNKNILAIFNKLPTKRLRIQEVYVYPRTLANIAITLQLGYINTEPTGGTPASINRHAVDFPSPGAGTIIALAGSTVTPVADVLFGGNTFNVNVAATYTIFKASRNGSALQLRPNSQDGIVLRQTSGTGTTGTITAHAIVTLD